MSNFNYLFEDPLEKIYEFWCFDMSCTIQQSFQAKIEKPKSNSHAIVPKKITQWFYFLIFWILVVFTLKRSTSVFDNYQTRRYTRFEVMKNVDSPLKLAHGDNRVSVSEKYGNFYDMHITKYSTVKLVETSLIPFKTFFKNMIKASNCLAYASISEQMVLKQSSHKPSVKGTMVSLKPVYNASLIQRQIGFKQSFVNSLTTPVVYVQAIDKNSTEKIIKPVFSYQKLDVSHLLQPCVYSIKNKKTGKAYIGETGNLPQRLGRHLSLLKKNDHHNDNLQSDWNHFQHNDFEFIILEMGNHLSSSPTFRIKYENYYIQKHLEQGCDVYNYYKDQKAFEKLKQKKNAISAQPINLKVTYLLSPGIYSIENMLTNCKYIGESEILLQRLGSHFDALKKNIHPNAKLQADWEKYSIKDFKFTILEINRYFTKQTRLIYETKYINDSKPKIYNYDYHKNF